MRCASKTETDKPILKILEIIEKKKILRHVEMAGFKPIYK